MSDTKTHIIQAAFDALKSDGLPCLSYDRIAKSAQVSRQVVRYHFRDPDDLMVSLCDHMAAVYRDILIENAKSLTGPVRIEMFLDFYFGTLRGDGKPEDDQVYDAMMSRATASEAVRTSLRGQYGLLGHVLSQEFQVAFPNLSQQAANELSFTFVSLMYGHWKMVASLGFGAHHNRVNRDAMARLIEATVAANNATAPGTPIWS